MTGSGSDLTHSHMNNWFSCSVFIVFSPLNWFPRCDLVISAYNKWVHTIYIICLDIDCPGKITNAL